MRDFFASRSTICGYNKSRRLVRLLKAKNCLIPGDRNYQGFKLALFPSPAAKNGVSKYFGGFPGQIGDVTDLFGILV